MNPNPNPNPNPIPNPNPNPNIWGPHFWFVLFTIGIHYPLHPNDVTKKKYFEFIQNLPMFLPNEQIGNDFGILLNKFPVTPYLDDRNSFIRWIHFIHNRVNFMLKKEQIPLHEALETYYNLYKPQHVIVIENIKYKHKIAFFIMISSLLAFIYYSKNK